MGPKFEGVWSNVHENIDCLEFARVPVFFFFFLLFEVHGDSIS